MAELENDLNHYIKLVREESDTESRRASEREIEEAKALHENEVRRESIRQIGLRAVNIFVAHKIPAVQIWDKVQIGETRPNTHYSRNGAFTYPDPIHALQNNRDGWSIMTKIARPGNTDDYGTPEVRYCLDENGLLQKYSRTSARDYRPSFYSEAYTADGIIEPLDLSTHQLEELVPSEMFKKAVASWVTGLGEYSY